MAVEKEFFASFTARIMQLGFFPIAGVLQMLFLLLCALLKQLWVVLLILLYICSAVLIIGYFRAEADRGLLYFGGGLWLFSHICVTVMAFMQPILKSQLKWLWLIPAVNMLYLPLRWFRDLQWSKVLLPLTGLVIFASSIYLMFQSRWSWAFAALLASWVCSITASLIWKSKSEK